VTEAIESATPQSFWSTFLLVFGAIALLFVFDTGLSRLERSESRSEARRLFAEGTALVRDGRSELATDRFRRALFIERGNRDYELALGNALMGAGKLEEATGALGELLQRDATFAPANLAMARVLAKEGRVAEASSYYHRAIYGQWPGDSIGNRVAVRFELIDLLLARDASGGVLAELLPLQAEAPRDPAVERRIGRIFLAAGSPTRAAEVYRRLVAANPGDPEAHLGLGRSAYAQGAFPRSRRYFAEAARLAPADSMARRYLALADSATRLDPTERGLESPERLVRSRVVLALVLADLTDCSGPSPAADVLAALDSARAAASRSPKSPPLTEATALDQAERLWGLRRRACPAKPIDPDHPLARVLAKVAQ